MTTAIGSDGGGVALHAERRSAIEGALMDLRGSPLAIETRGLVKRYGKTVALDGLELTVPEGAFYLLVGANGAGKSTTLKVLLDLVRARAGTAAILGIDARDASARARIGYVPESHQELYGWMRVRQVIAHHSAYYNAWDPQYADYLLTRLEIAPESRIGRLSKGQVRRVQILLALAHRPPVLLLDEPTDGLDPVARDDVLGLLAEHLAETPTTVLASTHLVYELDGLADHLGVMRDGRLSAQLRREDLERQVRSYALDTPERWTAPLDVSGYLLGRNGGPKGARWLFWGEESDVASALRAKGALIRDVRTVSLEEGARALLARREG